jgi:septum formation protein
MARERPSAPPRVVLASASPQRRELLERLGIAFTVEVSGVQELETGPPDEVALENAYRKAAAVAALPEHAGATVLGADTVVARGTVMYGKPRDREAAQATLQALSGQAHEVISAVCVISGKGRARTAADRATVRLRTLDERLLDWYLDSGEWRERAGGYAIQARGAALVEAIEGDWTTVVGLPVRTLIDLCPGLLGP